LINSNIHSSTLTLPMSEALGAGDRDTADQRAEPPLS
jgi:hypothetical protein